ANQENHIMTFRRSALTAFVLAFAVSSAAQAGTRNSVVANNVAAGVGNTAQQSVFANQFGSPSFAAPMLGRAPWLGGGGSNSINANNIAAGVGNTAIQGIGAFQGGRGSNHVDASNLAAGIGNFAGQQILTTQR
ncbi:MAG: hypothetical protein K2X44_07355, partial [Magnetospirillum sp.]|nr:hypothetical protein [Magnetospirillum sp.]